MCGLISLYPLNKALLKPSQKNEYYRYSTGANRKTKKMISFGQTSVFCIWFLFTLTTVAYNYPLLLTKAITEI